MRLRQRGQSNGNRQMRVRRLGHPLDKIRWIVICDIGESRADQGDEPLCYDGVNLWQLRNRKHITKSHDHICAIELTKGGWAGVCNR